MGSSENRDVVEALQPCPTGRGLGDGQETMSVERASASHAEGRQFEPGPIDPPLVFRPKEKPERYQVRFWTSPNLYGCFCDRVEAEGLQIGDVFNQFMHWFYERPYKKSPSQTVKEG